MTTPQANGTGPGNFDVQTSTVDEVLVLTVRGDVDALTAPVLAEEITACLAGDPSAFIVDLSEVHFLASAGMTALIVGQQVAGNLTRFAVVADGPSTDRPIKLVGLDRELSLYPTLSAALAEYR
jgi:anti-sigma B factor antagonist